MVYIQSLGVIDQYGINQTTPSVPTGSYDKLWPYYAVEDSPTLTPSLAATSDDDPNVATSAQGATPSSDTPTASLIQITALPPATVSSQAVLPKLPYRRQLNILYFIPLFVVLGVVFGAITVVVLLKWRENRRHLPRTSTLLPGPPYVPPEVEVEGSLLAHEYPSMEQVSLFAAGTPSKSTIHGSQYNSERTLAWQALGVTQPRYTQSTYTHSIVPSSDGERFTVVAVEDPVPVASPIVTGRSPRLSKDVSLLQTYLSPSLPDPVPGDNSSYRKARVTNLPKPFRRSMFDILKLKHARRSVPNAREEHTVLSPHDQFADRTPTKRVYGSTTKMPAVAGSSHSHSGGRSLDGEFHIGNMEEALGLLDSQDDKHDPVDASTVLPNQILRLRKGVLPSPIQGEEMRKPRRVTPFSTEVKWSPKEETHSGDESANEVEVEREKHSDIYTRAPQRHHSRTPHKTLVGGTSRRFSAPDTHVSVLPLSPPSLMSPPLEEFLFFTSSLSLSASLASSANILAAASSSPLHCVNRSPESSLFPLPSKRKLTKKLRTRRPEPLLPYPSYPSHLDAWQAPGKRSTSPANERRSVPPGSPELKGQPMSAASRESATGICSLGSLSPTSLAIALASSSSMDMLNKVNDIVAQGYTKKQTSVGGGEKIAAR